MSAVPLSDVTIIAAGLGVFFLIVAFYKSIFHKRRHPTHVPTPNAPKTVTDDHPIKLADPFQQVPVDSIPPPAPAKPQTPPHPFYPAYPNPPDASVSAFRQFNPNKDFEQTAASGKNDATYEWE